MMARWMDNEVGRFISPDPAQQGTNWYVYCNNNPTTNIDPTGLNWWSSWRTGGNTFGQRLDAWWNGGGRDTYWSERSSIRDQYWGNGIDSSQWNNFGERYKSWASDVRMIEVNPKFGEYEMFYTENIGNFDKPSYMQYKFAEWQTKIDIMEHKVQSGLDFTKDETRFAKGLYGFILPLGGFLKGYFEASSLISRYMSGKGDAINDPFMINSQVYEKSKIVNYAMDKMRKIIQDDLADGTLDNPVLSSEGLLQGTPNRNAETKGQIKRTGTLLAEQNNPRLKNADHQFPLYAKTEIMSNGKTKVTWYVQSNYDFESYSTGNNYYTRLPFSESRGLVLTLDDGLSEHLTHTGMAKTFYHKAVWTEVLE